MLTWMQYFCGCRYFFRQRIEFYKELLRIRIRFALSISYWLNPLPYFYESESWWEFWAKPQYHKLGSRFNFMSNANITSLTRSLNLGPSMIVSNHVFFLNTGAAIYAVSRTISCFKFQHSVSVASPLFLTIRAQRLGPDSFELNGIARG